MSTEIFARQIAEADARVADLRGRGPHEHSQSALLQESFQELQSALEELRVTEEEMHQQNEALEEALERATLEKLRYLDLFDAAPDGYVVTDSRGTILESNAAAQRLLGRSARFLTGKPITVAVAEESRTAVYRCLTDAGPVIEMHDWDVRLRHPQHGVFPASVTVAVVSNRSGGGLRWIIRDITQRRLAEDRARAETVELERLLRHTAAESEEAERGREEQGTLLQAVLESTRAGLALLDAAGRFVRVSPRFGERVGRVPEALLSQPMAEALPRQWAAARPFFESALAGGTAADAVWPGGTPDTQDDLRAFYSPVRVQDRLIGVSIVLSEAAH